MSNMSDTYTVEDARHTNWFWMDNAVIMSYAASIGPTGLAVYAHLAMNASNGSRHCYPSYETMARNLGMSRRSVITAVQKLENVGLISIHRRQAANDSNLSNSYTLLPLASVPPGANFAPPGEEATPLVQSDHYPGAKFAPELDSWNKTHESPLRGGPAGADARSASPASEQTQPDPLEPQPEPEPDRPGGGNGHSAGRAKKSRGRAVAPHPAIALVREATGRQPPPAARETITARVGTSDDDLARWRETITAWQCAGHNPHNITGMLDWYEKREEKREEQRNERTATQPQRKQRQPVAATGAAGGDVARCPEPDIPTGYADLPPEERRRIARERNQRAAARRC
jgi:DNA-binding transcriptional MerR regulator